MYFNKVALKSSFIRVSPSIFCSKKELIWKCSTEVVLAAPEHCQHGAITKPCGDVATELVETELKHNKGWRAIAEISWYRPIKAVITGIECC
jgi:hypothetical protein